MKVNKCIFLYNPSSGKGKVKKNIDIITKALTDKFGLLDVVESKSPEHLKEVVDMGCRTYDYFFPLIIIAIIYFLITLFLSKMVALMERRFKNVRN